MGRVCKDLKILISLWVMLILAIIFTYAHHGHLIIDSGREVYYPVQILTGKILYKDLFNIYGPFSYMLNALLYKVFGINLNVLYASGYVCSLLIVTLIYKLSRRFLPEFISFAVAFYTISVGTFNFHLFNFVFPYSYGMLYGLVGFLASVWFLLNYEKDSDKFYNLYLSCFFAGISVANKYEFLIYLIVLIYAVFKIKALEFKQYLYAIFSFLSIPVLCLGILFLQGLRINDLVSAIVTIKKMSETQTLKYFYLTQGVYFHKDTIPFVILNFIKTAIPFSVFYSAFGVKNKLFSFVLFSLAIILISFWTNPITFIFFPMLLLGLTALNFKNLKNNTGLMILSLCAISLSIKSIWGLNTLNYGVFFVSFLLIAITSLIFEKHKEINPKAVGYYVLILAIVLAFQNFYSMGIKSFYLKTDRGGVYTSRDFYNSSNELIKYINENTKKTDRIVILPEGAFVNFLTDRPSDDYYISLLPLYVETFGEEKIINHFKANKPEYIVFNNWNTKDYYFKYICQDYALGFCSFVLQNYTQQKVIDNGFRYLIYKRK